jgi:hypothetical protein
MYEIALAAELDVIQRKFKLLAAVHLVDTQNIPNILVPCWSSLGASVVATEGIISLRQKL